MSVTVAGDGAAVGAEARAEAAPRTPAVNERTTRAEWLWLLPLIALAVLLRAIGLDSGLWQDEIYALVETIRPPLSQIVSSYPADTHHPLYSILAHVSVSIFGESPWVIRLPALLFGVATIPALYALARRVSGRAEALIACVLLTASFHHVWFSQNARGYTALAFFATLCSYALLRGMQEQRARWFGLYACLVALAAYTHLTIVFMAVGHALLSAWITFGPGHRRRSSDWRLPLLAFGGGAVLTILLYLPMLDEVIWWYLYRPSELLGVSTPSWALVEGIRVLALGLGVNPILLAAGCAVFLAGVVSLWRQNAIVVGIIALPAIVTLAGALLARGTMYPRFFFFLAGLLILVTVRGAIVAGTWLAARLRVPHARRALAGYALAGAVIAASARSLGYNYAYPKQDFDGTIAHVQSARRAAEPVLIAGAHYPYTTYYQLDWQPISSVDEVEVRRSAGLPVWVVYMQPRYIEKDAPGLVAAIEGECADRRAFHGTVGGGEIIVCRLPARPH